MNNTFLAITFLFLASFPSNAQQFPCTTHSLTNAILEHSPEKRALLEQLNRESIEYTNLHYGERAGGLKVIPTVIHVIHDNGSENLSKNEILNVIDVVNEELRGQNNTSSVVSAFSGIIGDPQFELRLAKIDYNGDCTDGITRTISQQTYTGGEGVKDLVNWNGGSRRYLQVWLVNSLSSGAGGYTYLPGTTGAETNGIIIRAAQFQGSLAHEFGHWMNLSHTWGPTNEPETASNCNFDDNVSDTPNTVGTSGTCNTAQESCGSLDNVQNHMDYSSCARMFTLGQAARMESAANSTTGGRSTYWSGANRQSTGTNDGFSNSCVPTVAFYVDNTLGCEGFSVDFEDTSFGADEDPSWVWNWSFPGGTPSTSNEQNPTVTYNTAGTYNVSLTITNNAGTASETTQNAVTVTELGGGLTGPFEEGMEDSSFPNNSGADSDWSIDSPGGLTWQRSTTAFSSGAASVRINLRSITAGNSHSLISPAIDMSDVASADAEMTFMLAHSNRNSTSHSERLRVYVSRNCGETWTLRYNNAGDNLNTAGGSISGTFVPNANQWRQESVSLATMAGEEHVLIKFEATSDNQSYLYIDDININRNASGTGVSEAGVISTLRVYPNPINGISQLEVSVLEAMDADIVLTNVMGQTLSLAKHSLMPGINRVSLATESALLSAGIYLIQVRSELGMKAVRLVKD
ncbi:MAG: PKD domain-containing protein [Flavobacteriales bacterium]|nr:PKD domain-containing protein [Flavobacteriales bacterium]